jgi:methenyltetrahydromethanopterin cyclohydrolase
MKLNERAKTVVNRIVAAQDRLRIAVKRCESGAQLIDLGIGARGGLDAGLELARVCTAGLATIEIHPPASTGDAAPTIAVHSDHPVAACMASQYAGWQIAGENFFAMGSGPMRAAAGREDLFVDIGFREQPTDAVGVLESAQLPPKETCREIAERCGVAPDHLTLLVAPTASQAGGVQIVARSLETALHKMHELGIDLGRVESGYGCAPLPPVAGDDLTAIGRTNDAVLYGGRVTIWVRGDDASLTKLGSKIPSCSSADYGSPFLTTFEKYDRDFYKIDPLLFSPAVVCLNNIETGRSYQFGELRPDVLAESFA